jgi:heme/copper-type cytochrome/quinol oxidase subunit 2
MHISDHKTDLIYLVLLVVLMAGLPLGIRAYDRQLEPQSMPPGTKEFTLTGSAHHGWVLGEVKAHSILSLWQQPATANHPVLEVTKGDRVVLKLRSSDVTHGFTLKAYGIYLTEGIKPGKTVYVSFDADKVGTFIFTCNVFCGDVHQRMQGTLVVSSGQRL